MTVKERAKKIKMNIPVIYLSMQDKNTPILAKVFGALTLIYALSPIDLIPDFIPVLGYLDDLILLPILAAVTIRLIPKNIFERNRIRAEGMWKNGRPEKWYYAIPIVLIWILIIWWVIKLVWL